MKRMTVTLTDEEYKELIRYNSDVNKRIAKTLHETCPEREFKEAVSVSTSAAVLIFDQLKSKGYLK